MPQVVFREDFFDGSRRYKAHETYDVSDSVVLPTQDIISIDGKPLCQSLQQRFVRGMQTELSRVTTQKRPTLTRLG